MGGDFYIGYATAIADVERVFKKESRPYWSDNSYCTEVIESLFETLDKCRKECAKTIGEQHSLVC